VRSMHSGWESEHVRGESGYVYSIVPGGFRYHRGYVRGRGAVCESGRYDRVNDDDTACAGHAGIAGVPCQRQDMQGTQLSREPKTRTDSHWYSPVSPLQRPSSPWSSSVRAVNPAPCMAQHVEQS
jgi:hypothetical protein